MAPRIPKRALTPILGVGVLTLTVVTALLTANHDPKARMHPGAAPATGGQITESPSMVDPGATTEAPGATTPAAPKSVRPRVVPSQSPSDPPVITLWQSSDDVTIPDGVSEANSVITVAGRHGSAPADFKVWVDVKHKKVGDLEVHLIGPSGRAFPLPVSPWSINLNTTYTVDATSEPCNGQWRLRVRDLKGDGSFGYLDNWSVEFS